MPEQESSPFAPRPETNLKHEEVYVDSIKDDAEVDEMRDIVRPSVEQVTEVPKLGDKLLVLRNQSGAVEEWTVALNDQGETVITSVEPDGTIVDKPLTTRAYSRETQQALAQKRAVDDARDELEDMKFYPSQPVQITMPERVTTPPAPAADQEPYIGTDFENARHLKMTVIEGVQDPEPPKKKKWFQR